MCVAGAVRVTDDRRSNVDTTTKLVVAIKSALRALLPAIVALAAAYEQGKLTGVSAAISVLIGVAVKFLAAWTTAKDVTIRA